MKTTTPPVQARAPGKLILSGEHAVVYGLPALAAAVNRHAAATVTPCPTCRLCVESPFGRAEIDTEAEGEALCRDVLRRYAAFEADALPIGAVLGNPHTFLLMPWLLMRQAYGERVPDGRRLTIRTDLPLGAGMGSSAAMAAASVTAIAGDAGLALSPAEVAAHASAVERLQHGRPSGIDVHLAVHGGAVWYRRNRPAEMVAPPATPFVLAQTGTPAAGTGECVAHVRRRYAQDAALWSAFGAVSARIRDAWIGGDEEALVGAVRENHRLLSAIGVVPEPVRTWIAGLEAVGGAAKICGAGAVRGPHGGVVWVVGAAARREAKQGPYPILQVEVKPHGARLVR